MTITQLDTLSVNVLHVKGDADANRFLGRQDSTTKSSSLPRGVLAYAQITTSQTGIGTGLTALTGLSVTVSVPANRVLKITGYALLAEGTSAAGGTLAILEDGTSVQYATVTVLNNTITPIARRTPKSGSHTYSLSVTFTANANNSVQGQLNQPAFILVEDIGSVG